MRHIPTVDDIYNQNAAWFQEVGWEYTREMACETHEELVAADKYLQHMDEVLATVDLELRPIDQFSRWKKLSAKTKKTERLSEPHWVWWRRWPWRVVLDDGYTTGRPPWVSHGIGAKPPHLLEAFDAIPQCLKYALLNAEFLPKTTPVFGYKDCYFGEATDSLPDHELISSDFIPRRIVGYYEAMRCRESLAFVFSFSGSPEMDAIRRLIIAPTRERVAEAYAISTSQDFVRSKLHEKPPAGGFSPDGKEPPSSPKLNGLYQICQVHPNVEESKPLQAVLRTLLTAETSNGVGGGWSVNEIAKNGIYRDAISGDKGTSKTSVSRYIKELAKSNLVASVGEGTAKRWRLGSACYQSAG